MTTIQPLTEPETYRVQDVAAKVNELVEVVNSLASAMVHFADVMRAALDEHTERVTE